MIFTKRTPLVRGIFIITATLLVTACKTYNSSVSETIELPQPAVVAVTTIEQDGLNFNTGPVWQKGDTWLWSDGYGLKVTDIVSDITRN